MGRLRSFGRQTIWVTDVWATRHLGNRHLGDMLATRCLGEGHLRDILGDKTFGKQDIVWRTFQLFFHTRVLSSGTCWTEKYHSTSLQTRHTSISIHLQAITMHPLHTPHALHWIAYIPWCNDCHKPNRDNERVMTFHTNLTDDRHIFIRFHINPNSML